MQDVRVTEWPRLNRELFENTWNAAIRRYRSDFVYRGMSEVAADLRTGLRKLGGNIREVEFHILRNFKKYAPEDTVREDSQWNWLAVAQYHGVPTRLLDWSYSQDVALHFASEDLDPAGAEMGGAGQARPGQHHRARAAARAGRPGALAEAALHAQKRGAERNYLVA